MNPINFGLFLRNKRREKGLTLKELGSKIGLSQPYLSQIEKGQRGIPSPELLMKLASPLGVNYALLLLEAGYISKGTLMDDGHMLVTKEDYESAKKELESLPAEKGDEDEDGDEYFYLELDNILQLPEITYKTHEITMKDRQLIKMYLDTLFAERLKKEDYPWPATEHYVSDPKAAGNCPYH